MAHERVPARLAVVTLSAAVSSAHRAGKDRHDAFAPRVAAVAAGLAAITFRPCPGAANP
jgi:hypothetical protein